MYIKNVHLLITEDTFSSFILLCNWPEFDDHFSIQNLVKESFITVCVLYVAVCKIYAFFRK